MKPEDNVLQPTPGSKGWRSPHLVVCEVAQTATDESPTNPEGITNQPPLAPKMDWKVRSSPRRGGGSRAAAHQDALDTNPYAGGSHEPVSSPNRPDPPEGGNIVNNTHTTPETTNVEEEPQIPSLNREQRRNIERQRKKSTKAAIRVGSINIRGYRSAGDGRSGSKWFHINQLIRDKRLGILAVQETHLTEERKEDLERLFSKRMKIFISKDPDNPTGKAGVAIVLNREITNVTDAKITEIIPGRAILIQTNWHRAEKISVLAVYAPNLTRAGENAEFWKTLRNYFTIHPRVKVDILTATPKTQ
ncbi:hypothetical protein D9615_002745 [Tricholomella constricta]|uniref:Endonuclease/exonuclease/phosphatase domain-containing protein n=1 Tax=Tricholomella constricta TaxID=117010 RepID=A0A8H5HFU6_9AGAR|nr:hypothetical protein D9615_002745 [Tricholomella constricta]